MSVRKLTKSAFAALTASLLCAFGLWLYGSRTGTAISAVVAALSLGLLYHMVFGRLLAGPGAMTDGCRRMFSSMPVPAIELDAAGRVVALNDAALDSGVPPSAIGGPLAGLGGPLEGTNAIDLPVTREDGTTLRLLVGAMPIERNGARSGTLLIGRDDTTRLETELDRVRAEARQAEAKLNGTIRDLEEFALMAVRRETKMQQIREKLSELREGAGASGGGQ